MTKKYVMTRIPLEAWNGFFKKKQAMESMIKNDLKKYKSKVKMADTLRFFSQRQTLVYPSELEFYLYNKKKKRSKVI